jgi:murein L,D-transpeptidase YcbB/YkuD
MEYRLRTCPLDFLLIFMLVFIVSCNNSAGTTAKDDIVSDPEEMNEAAGARIKESLSALMQQSGKLNDTIRLFKPAIVNYYYNAHEHEVLWSQDEQWKPAADSIFDIISRCREYGLFPADYHSKNLLSLRTKLQDSVARMNATLWTNADLLLTDAFFQLADHLKRGRLSKDSISMTADSALAENFYSELLDQALVGKSNKVKTVLHNLEPKHRGYVELRNAVKSFLDSADLRPFAYVVYPNKDSIALVKQVSKRLNEIGYIDYRGGKAPDSLSFRNAVLKYQRAKGLKADGKVGSGFVAALNNTDANKFARIAITLDRYKQMPGKMPDTYVWVNIPSYMMYTWDHDTLAVVSKVIVGKPQTRTPQLNSEINNFITYPTWTPPVSIISKEILPAVKRNPGYLSRRGFFVVDGSGRKVDPYSINWARYSGGSLPYKIRQYEGSGNALGVLKFNFDNKYAVYLHDTNQRYLFDKSYRSLSHGCVRVKEWEKLANFLARNDSVTIDSVRIAYHPDTLKSWITKHRRQRIDLKKRVPIFIRYFTCEGKDGKVLFYDDIYGDDRALRDKYFADK